MDQELIQVSIQKEGVYFIYKLSEVKRGIRGKTKGKVDEVIIVGIPLNDVNDYCKKEELIITSERVCFKNLDQTILTRKEGMLYVK